MLKLWARLAILVKKRVRDSIIAKIALVLSLVVVFCTTYLLILPALTISTGNSSSVFQSSESASSQVESPTDDSQKENNQTKASSQASLTDSSQEKKDMSQAGTLTAETSDVTVTVSYEGDTFTEPVQLKVKPVSDTTAIDNKLTSLLSESKQSLSLMVARKLNQVKMLKFQWPLRMTYPQAMTNKLVGNCITLWITMSIRFKI